MGNIRAKNSAVIMALIWSVAILLASCASPALQAETVQPEQPALPPVVSQTTVPTSPPVDSPVRTTSPDAGEAAETSEPDTVSGTIVVRDGDTLECDIIPQLCRVFGLETEEVKAALASANSDLIDDDLKGFRRMEGIIVPGEYKVAEETLDEYVDTWTLQAKQRFDRVAAACERNGLKPYEQLTLASIVEWECIGDAFEREAAAAFLNRLDNGEKLRSCVTTEYALGYQRPYLTSEDIKIDSDYNTYQVKGLPPGPICSVDDDSLAAGISPAVDTDIYYFFYDYAPDTMQFFAGYDAFKAAAKESAALFEQTFDFGKYDKVDKRAVFGS